MSEGSYFTLTTPYSENFDKTRPWDVYPRPQLKRESYINLNGEWDFTVSESADAPYEFSEKITVPYPPESALSGIGRRIKKNQFLFYRRYFTIPEGFLRDRLIIHFGAVDCICDLYINGKGVCHNEGGYIPFSADITDFLCEGENEILLKVKDGTDKRFPYGKQKEKRGGMWYTPVSGIWQTVWLESLPEKPIRGLKIHQSKDRAVIEVDTDATEATLILSDGTEIKFDGGTATVSPENPILWTPENPHLYEFEVRTENDSVTSYFALREVGVGSFGSHKRLTLNGQPYLFNGLLDQGYFPDGIFLPASPDGYEKDILMTKALGFNTLRKHIKVEPMIFYYLCDKLGMVVFQDMVNCGSYSFLFDTAFPTVGINYGFSNIRNRDRKARENFRSNMLKTAELLYNCPSVCLYTVFNEGWGQFNPDEEYRRLKEFDRSRIIDTTSGWFKGKMSDVDSRHIYFRAPEIKKPDEKPFFLSEFGGFSLRVEGHVFSRQNYGYSTLTDSEHFLRELKKLYSEQLTPLIKMGLSALIYTQVSDVEDETNGFMTYDRRVCKIEPGDMKKINEELYGEFNNCI